MGDFGLLATEVLGKAGGWNRLLAEPEVLLREAERAEAMVSTVVIAINPQHSLLETRRLVAQSAAVDGLSLLYLVHWSSSVGFSGRLLSRSSSISISRSSSSISNRLYWRRIRGGDGSYNRDRGGGVARNDWLLFFGRHVCVCVGVSNKRVWLKSTRWRGTRASRRGREGVCDYKNLKKKAQWETGASRRKQARPGMEKGGRSNKKIVQQKKGTLR